MVWVSVRALDGYGHSYRAVLRLVFSLLVFYSTVMCYDTLSLIVNLMVKGCSVDFEWEATATGYGVGTYRFKQYQLNEIKHLYGSQIYAQDVGLLGQNFSFGTGSVVFEKENYNRDKRRFIKLKDYPEMCFEFAALELFEENILSFAKRYGLLGVTTSVNVPTDKEPGALKDGEPFQLWMIEIIGLRVAVILWESIEKRDEAELRKHVQWVKRGPVMVAPPGFDDFKEFGNPAIRNMRVIYNDELPQPEQGDVITPARHWLKEAINARLAAYTHIEVAESNTGSLVYNYHT